jgi:selenocysteine lyase/cysteine desulfurase
MPTASLAHDGDFGPFDGRVWLNAAHQGPLPKPAYQAALQFVADRVTPHRIADTAFSDVPERLRTAIGALLQRSAEDIAIGTSATSGVALLAQGIRWEPGDEIVVFQGDFPSTVLPWRYAESGGARLRFIDSGAAHGPSPQDVAEHLSNRTRVVALSWVNSFTGYRIDVRAIAELCNRRNIIFVLNVSQGLGTLPVDDIGNVDAIVCCGYKWLLGPYGTGFAWIRPELRATLKPPPPYWLPNVWGGRGEMTAYEVRTDLAARAFDVPGTPSFLNNGTWIASFEYLLGIGMKKIAAHNDALVEEIVQRIPSHCELVSPAAGKHRSTLVVIRARDGNTEELYRTLTAAGVDVAYRQGAIRIAPHLYNASSDVDRLLAALAAG